jgi:hypothetical protein
VLTFRHDFHNFNRIAPGLFHAHITRRHLQVLPDKGEGNVQHELLPAADKSSFTSSLFLSIFSIEVMDVGSAA